MSKSFLGLLIPILLGLLSNFFPTEKTNESDAILGSWANANNTAHFKMYKKDSRYFGKVIWGKGENNKDIKNPDPQLRSRELIGLTILNNFLYTGKKTWEEGTIYDPNEGKTYACKLTLSSPKKLEVRGYVGIPLFGRSETWTKID